MTDSFKEQTISPDALKHQDEELNGMSKKNEPICLLTISENNKPAAAPLLNKAAPAEKPDEPEKAGNSEKPLKDKESTKDREGNKSSSEKPDNYRLPKMELALNDRTDVPKTTDKSDDLPARLDASQSKRLVEQQQFISREISKLPINAMIAEAAKKGIEDDMKGIIRDKSGKIIQNLGYPIHGTITKQTTALIKEYLNQNTKLALEGIAKAKIRVSVNAPPLPINERGAQKGFPQSPELLLAEASNGRTPLQFNFDPDTILSNDQIKHLKANREFRQNCDASLANVRFNRITEIARREIARNGYSWSVNTPEEATAAMFVLDTYRQTANLIQAVQSMSETIGESTNLDRYLNQQNKDNWLAQISTENLSKFGCEIIREGNNANGKIEKIAFAHPTQLTVMSPEFRQQLRALKKWNDKIKGTLSQQINESSKALKDRRRILINGEFERSGWVRQTSGEKPYEVKMQKDKPTGEGWAHFNLVDRHIGVKEVRNKAGDLEKVKVSALIDYCDIPPYDPRSYLNLVKPHASVETTGKQGENREIKTEKIEIGEFKPNENLIIAAGGAAEEHLPAKGLSKFVSSQEFWQNAGKGTTAAMDLSIVLGVGGVSAGGRAVRMATRETEGLLGKTALHELEELATKEAVAAKARGVETGIVLSDVGALTTDTRALAVVQEASTQAPQALATASASATNETETVFTMLERSAKNNAIPDAAEILAKLKQNPVALKQALEDLAARGRHLTFHSGLGLITGGGGITNNAGAKEIDGLKEFNDIRGLYFLSTIGKGTLIDPAISLTSRMLGVEKAVPLAERLLAATVKTEPGVIRALGEANKWGFLGSQLPFCSMQAASVSRQVDDLAKIGTADPLIVSVERMLDSAEYESNTSHKNAAYPERRAAKQYNTAETAVQFLDNYRKSLKVSASQAQEIDKIIADTKKFLTPPWQSPNFVGPIDEKQKAAFETEKRRFIEQKLVPHLISSGLDIKNFESAHARELISRKQLAELANKKTFTAEEIKEKDALSELKTFDSALRSTAAVALLWLGNNPNSNKKSTPANAEILFQREQNIPAWRETAVIARHRAGLTDEMKFSSPERTITQEIKIEDLAHILEQDLISSGDKSPSQYIYTGELLARIGVPGETYGAVLKEVINNKNASADEKNQAIANLGVVMIGLQTSETRRATQLTAADLQLSKGLSSGLSANDLHNFLVDFSKDARQDLNQRALASYMAQFYRRNTLELDSKDLDKLRDITSKQPAFYSYDQFYADTTRAAFKETPISLADWNRKFQAAQALQDFINADGNLKAPNISGLKNLSRYGLKEINQSFADCIKASLIGEQEAAKARAQLTFAKKAIETPLSESAKTQANEHLAKVSEVREKAEVKRLLSSDLALKCLDSLMQPVNINGVIQPRLYHMDNSSNESDRQAAIESRKNLLELVKSPCAEAADIRIKVTLLENLQPLLQDKHLSNNKPETEPTRELIAQLRIEACQALEATLIPGLDNSSKGQARIAAIEKGHPGVIDALRAYNQLYANSQAIPELREAAIHALNDMHVSDARQLIKGKLYVENEPDADVRLAAIKCYRSLVSAEEFKRVSEDLLNRKAGNNNHPPERDAAIILALQQGYAANGPDSAPNTVAYRDRVNYISALMADANLERATIEKKITNNPDYEWLLPGALRNNMINAKREAYGTTVLGYGQSITGFIHSTVDSWHDWPFSQNTVANREAAAERAVIDNYRKEVEALQVTAYEGSEKSKQEAQEILYWLATSAGTEWLRTKDGDKALAEVGQSNANLFVGKQDFAKLQIATAATLANCYSRSISTNKSSTGDPNLSRLEKTLQRGLLDPNTPVECKMHFMRGLFAASAAQVTNNTLDGQQQNSAKITANASRSLAQNVDVVKHALNVIAPATRNSGQDKSQALDSRNNDSQKQNTQLALQLIEYLSLYANDNEVYSELDGIATRTDFPARIVHAARELTADHRDSVLAIRSQIPRDETFNGNVAERRRLLNESVEAAGSFVIDGQKAPGNEKWSEDECRAKQEKQDRLAIYNIFAATKDAPINKDSDSRLYELADLMEEKYHKSVRLAAAIALIDDSNVTRHQETATKFIAEQSTFYDNADMPSSSDLSRYGYQRDAQITIDQLQDPKRLNAFAIAFGNIRNDFIEQMKAKTPATAHGTETAIVAEYQRLHKDDYKLQQYAMCLDNLATIKLKMIGETKPMSENMTEINSLLQGAANLYSRKPYTTPLSPYSLEIERQLVKQVREEHFSSIAHCVNNLGDYYKKLGLPEKARYHYQSALRMLYLSVGKTHPLSARVENNLRNRN